MERPIFTPGQFLKEASEYTKAIVRAFSIVLTISFISFSTQAQVNCNAFLACNNGVQISLDNDCNMTIEPNMILQGLIYPNSFYDVEVKLPNGTLLPQFTVGFESGNPVRRVAINRTHIGMTLQVKVLLRGCSNSCWGTAKVEDKLPPVISTCPCEPRITSFVGMVSYADPSFNRPISCPGPITNGVKYKTHNFVTDATGTVDISLPSLGVRFSLYATSFNPADSCTNLIATNVNSFSGALSANTNYILVVSSISNISFPDAFDYTVFMDSRVGNIKSSTTATVCAFDCGQEATILGQTANDLTNRPLFMDACSGPAWSATTTGFGTIAFNSSSIVLTGGSSGGSTGVVVGAQVCYTSPISQTITFDWATTLLPNVVTDSAFYTVNGVPTVLSTTLMSQANRAVNIPANGVFCFKVNTENAAPDNVLTITNIRVSGQSPALVYTKIDSVVTLLCNERYGKIIYRRWTATDASGNVSEVKTQLLYIRRGSISTIICPADWNIPCNQSFTKLPNGAPAPMAPFQPQNIGCDNLQVFYDDTVFPLCGVGIKVHRKWTIIDWCTGRDTICNQAIRVEDNVQPDYTCPVLPNISTGSENCTGTWKVTPPSATDCSSMTWDVLFSKDSMIFVKSDLTTTITGTVPAFAPTISASARPYTITGLPLGKTWIKYIVKDTCNNNRECITSITVVDLTPPIAICEDETIVSIDDNGWGVLKAASLDDHSHDNCGIIAKFEVRRKTTTCPGYPSETSFGPEVRFCCSDVTAAVSYIAVVLRVYDAAGNYNECETTVRVQNKRPPAIQCNNLSRTLTCGDPRIAAWVSGTIPFDTAFFGKPTVSGICSDLQIGSRIIANNLHLKCGTGTVVRQWFIVSSPLVSCTQVLTVVPPAFNASDIVWPGDITLATCDLTKATPDVLNSKPIIPTLACRDIGSSFTEQIFRDVPGTCVKILRTWRIIDWCTYTNQPLIAEHTQKILLMGSGGATFTGCTNQSFDTDLNQCEKTVTISVNASDECTDEEDLNYFWTLDLNKNGSIDATGFTRTSTRSLPKGTHGVTFRVTNSCGTVKTCSYDITIRSVKKPTPVCIREVVWVMDPRGSTEIWASDFNLKSENNCGSVNLLTYRFDSQFGPAARTFTCAQHIPNGQVARIPLKMYVIDENGNFDFCDVILILQDSPLTNSCPDNPALLPSVAGKITTESNEGLLNTEVALKNMATSGEKKDMTSNKGEYKFEGVDVFDPKSIGAYKNNDVLNGISTLDLVIMQRHILGIQKITSPYKLLAADVNNSRNVSAGDLVALRKVILGVTEQFDNNTSWRFVPAYYKFSDPESPFDFPEKISIDSVFEDRNNVNFIAVKVGDLNSNALANANSESLETRSANAVFTADITEFNAGDVVRYEIKAGERMDVIGAQFALNFDADALVFQGVKGGALDIKPNHYNPFNISAGQISFSYDVANGLTINEQEILMTLEFKAKAKGNTTSIKLDPNKLKPEVYESDASIRQLFVQNRDNNKSGIQNILYQNEPNPFKETTNISFELAKASDVAIRILDVTGKLLYNQNRKFEKGFNQVLISNNQLGKSGVYYYQIDTGDFTATKKMILIE